MISDILAIIFWLVPDWVWHIVSGLVWSILVYMAIHRLNFRNSAMLGLLLVMAFQALSASSVAIATSQHPTNDFSCRMGVYGLRISLVLIVVEIFVLCYLSKQWPRNFEGRKNQFRTWVSIWFAFNLIALLTHLRSALLCTV